LNYIVNVTFCSLDENFVPIDEKKSAFPSIVITLKIACSGSYCYIAQKNHFKFLRKLG